MEKEIKFVCVDVWCDFAVLPRQYFDLANQMSWAKMWENRYKSLFMLFAILISMISNLYCYYYFLERECDGQSDIWLRERGILVLQFAS